MPSCPSSTASASLSLPLSLLLFSFLSFSSSFARAFIARYLFRPPLAAKSRGDGERRHGNFVTVFFHDDENVPVDRRMSYFPRKRERKREDRGAGEARNLHWCHCTRTCTRWRKKLTHELALGITASNCRSCGGSRKNTCANSYFAIY